MAEQHEFHDGAVYTVLRNDAARPERARWRADLTNRDGGYWELEPTGERLPRWFFEVRGRAESGEDQGTSNPTV